MGDLFRLKALTYISLVLLLFACNNSEHEECKKENEFLRSEKASQDSMLNTVFNAYGEIDSTSFIIETKKAKINSLVKQGALSEEDKSVILAEMDTINILLESNNKLVSELEEDMGDNDLHDGLGFVVQSMDDKNDSEIENVNEMKSDLAQISHDFSILFEDYIYQEAENMEMKEQLSSSAKELKEAQDKLDEAKEKLNSGWYIIGSETELKAKGLIDKKGFFNIKEVNEDFDKNQFRKVNIYELKELLLDAKKVDIITTHPTESYYIAGIKKKVNKLVISNPDLFWSVSKFLIIEIEK